MITAPNAVFMGHARYATFGEKNRENAQPFEFPTLVGTHNGTLSYQSKNRLEGVKHMKTDSMALYHRIDTEGLDAALKLMDEDDALALVWYDKLTNEINFFRNNKRPLYYCIDKTNSTLYWASEPGMIYMVLNRVGIEFDKVKAIPELVHMKMKLQEKPEIQFNKAVTSVKKMQKFVYPSITYHSTNDKQGKLFNVNDKSDLVIIDNRQPNVVSLADKIKDNGILRLSCMQSRSEAEGGNFYRGYGGKIYDKEEFQNKVYEGCACCSAIVGWCEPVKFLKDGGFFCAPCVATARACNPEKPNERYKMLLQQH